MASKLLLGSVSVLFVAVLGYAYITLPARTATPTHTDAHGDTQASDGASEGSTPGETSEYTLATVAIHNSASSCWAAINGNVYDLTDWISQHPGGPEHILGICGTDGSAAFNTQHGGERDPAQELKNFYIGTLSR